MLVKEELLRELILLLLKSLEKTKASLFRKKEPHPALPSSTLPVALPQAAGGQEGGSREGHLVHD